VELEAWKGWQRTIGKVRTIREEGGRVSGVKSKLPPEKTVTTIETQAGDPRFLQTILECVRRRCEILGLNAPVEARITGRLSIDDLREILEAAEEPEEECAGAANGAGAVMAAKSLARRIAERVTKADPRTDDRLLRRRWMKRWETMVNEELNSGRVVLAEDLVNNPTSRRLPT